MAEMTEQQRNEFLSGARIATLVTLQADGWPTGVAIWFEWDGERARAFTSRGSPKVRRIRADPRACLVVAEPTGVPEAWVTIEGTARILEAGGMDLARRLAPRYYPTEQARQAVSRWEAIADRWVVVEIEPRRIRSLAPE
jgi:PPOX class probable F420-dependent enzyme